METKGITCKIPLDLHQQITREIQDNEITMGKFVEQIIREHLAKEEKHMDKSRTMAFQVSEEFFQRIKEYLARYEQIFGKKLSQRQFVLGLIQQALENSEEEFNAACACRHEMNGAETESVQ